MKKLVFTIFVIVLSLSLTLALASCEEPRPSEEPTAEEPTAEEPTAEEQAPEEQVPEEQVPEEQPSTEETEPEETTIYTVTVHDRYASDYILSYTKESETFTIKTPTGAQNMEFIGWQCEDTVVSEYTVEKGSTGNIEIIAVYKCLLHVDANGDRICDNGSCLGECDTSLFINGAPTFKFVMGSDASAHMTSVTGLAQELSQLSGNKVDVVTESSAEQVIEIFIGTVSNRGEQYVLDLHSFGERGYTVQQIGSKIIVTGGSRDAIENAINHLKTKVFRIQKVNSSITNITIKPDNEIVNIQDDYTIKSFTVSGKSIREFVITTTKANGVLRGCVQNLQSYLYKKSGNWCEIEYDSEKSSGLIIFSIENDATTPVMKVADGCVVFTASDESGVMALFDSFVSEYITNGSGDISFNEGFEYSPKESV